MMTPVFPIGTRGSMLAVVQANEAAAALSAGSGLPIEAFPLIAIKTTGDLNQEQALANIGGKGLFTKEIDQAQLDGKVDFSIHCAKDMPTELPKGLVIAGYLAREDVRDVLISGDGSTLMDLPHGAVVGTVSLRRQALLKRLRPDLVVTVFRGNIDTRLAKIRRGEAAATLLALAGLKRTGLESHATELLGLDAFPPAVGQGAIALVTRTDDQRSRALVEKIAHGPTCHAVTAERALLRALDGSCRMPIAGHATVSGDRLSLRGLVLSPDGRSVFEDHAEAAVHEAEALGRDMGIRLKARLPAGFLGARAV